MCVKKKKKKREREKYLTTVKRGKATTFQYHSGTCLTEEQQILNRWTEYCSELYYYKASGDPSVLNCPSILSVLRKPPQPTAGRSVPRKPS